MVYSGVDEEEDEPAEDSGSSSWLVDAESGEPPCVLFVWDSSPFSWKSSSPPATR